MWPKLIFLPLLLFSFTTFAQYGSSLVKQDNEKFVCSTYYILTSDLLEQIDHPDAPIGYVDKYKHCALSCLLTRRCGTFDTFSIGLIKEFLDLLGLGHAEWDDLRANFIGLRFARSGPGKYSDLGCLESCLVIDQLLK